MERRHRAFRESLTLETRAGKAGRDGRVLAQRGGGPSGLSITPSSRSGSAGFGTRNAGANWRAELRPAGFLSACTVPKLGRKQRPDSRDRTTVSQIGQTYSILSR
ncbi:hypothetical protein BD309DRAFT_959678 [Dichomitus squalens]|nr:hypothetical protein BD309DRAFT_959678 [Dichomitus squalens]